MANVRFMANTKLTFHNYQHVKDWIWKIIHAFFAEILQRISVERFHMLFLSDSKWKMTQEWKEFLGNKITNIEHLEARCILGMCRKPYILSYSSTWLPTCVEGYCTESLGFASRIWVLQRSFLTEFPEISRPRQVWRRKIWFSGVDSTSIRFSFSICHFAFSDMKYRFSSGNRAIVSWYSFNKSSSARALLVRYLTALGLVMVLLSAFVIHLRSDRSRRAGACSDA